MMLCVVLVLSTLLASSEARGAGRAFPIASENYVIEAFQRINRFIEWDETNFLVDLAGLYANCDNLGRGGSFVQVDKRTPDGVSVGAYVDDTRGGGSDYNRYIQDVIDRWTRDYGSAIYNQIQSADRFGCSVRPGCSGNTVVACLFSPGEQRPSGIEGSPIEPNALAFTRQQYDLAERITGQKWDNSTTLENLSGAGTSCAMLVSDSLTFPQTTGEAERRGMKVEMLYGSALNRGETEPAIVEVLRSMKKMSNVKKVGCSLIPDCMDGSNMFVVVGCLFQFN